MRSHRNILREIADKNLDPKVAYVAFKGQLKEKELEESPKVKEVSQEKDHQVLSEIENTDKVVEENTEQKKSKKVPPPRKKKESTTDE